MTKLIGKKLKMTQIFSETGKNLAVTPISIIDGDPGILKPGDLVKASSVSKGKGFQGVVRRHGFGGGPRTHGQKNRLRHSGSIGSTAPQRVIKGKRMAGRTGGDRVSLRNL